MKKRISVGITAAALAFLLGVCAFGPVISCEMELPENCMEVIESQARDLYSKRLPLIPVCVKVNEYSEETVFYTIHYFPIGTVGMSYHRESGCYNIEKPLTRL